MHHHCYELRILDEIMVEVEVKIEDRNRSALVVASIGTGEGNGTIGSPSSPLCALWHVACGGSDVGTTARRRSNS